MDLKQHQPAYIYQLKRQYMILWDSIWWCDGIYDMNESQTTQKYISNIEYYVLPEIGQHKSFIECIRVSYIEYRIPHLLHGNWPFGLPGSLPHYKVYTAIELPIGIAPGKKQLNFNTGKNLGLRYRKY